MGSLMGSMLGYQASQDQLNAAKNAQMQALAQYLGISVPELQSQMLDLGQYQNAGDFAAQLEAAQQMGPTAMENIAVDPRIAQAQMQALQTLSQTGQTGLLPGEQAALNQANRAAAAQAQAKSAQLATEFQRRGMGGSGNELAARLQAAQSGADRASQDSNALMQQAQNRALNAISQQGSLAGQMQGQQFGQQADIARAKDYINQFNTQNQQNVQQRNAQAGNAANLRNLQNRQQISQQNTGLANSQQQYNKQLQQQRFNNQMSLAAGRAGQYQGVANMNNQQAGRTADMWGNIGRGVDTAAGSYFANQRPSDNNSGFSKDEEDAWLDDGII